LFDSYRRITMLRKTLVLAAAVILTALAVSSKAQAWGAYHAGFTRYSPYTGLHHYGYTEAYRGGYGYGGYGRYGYGGYRYGGYRGYGGYYPYGYGYGGAAYGGARYGYYRAW
jgi:hypothetical protein